MATDDERIAGALRRLVDFFTSALPHLSARAGRVAKQAADRTLSIVPDLLEVAFPPRSVPIVYGIPGVTAKVPPGARCRVRFVDGDPSKPEVVGWEPGAILELAFDGGTKGLARVDDTGDAGILSWVFTPAGAGGALAILRAPPTAGGGYGAPALLLTITIATGGVAPLTGSVTLGTVNRTGASKVKA